MGVFADRKKSKIATLAVYAVLLVAIVMLIVTLLTAKEEPIVYGSKFNENGSFETNSHALKFYKYNDEQKMNVSVAEMMPGDVFTKSYSVEVFAKEKTALFFKVKPLNTSAKLNEVLKVKVVNTDSGETMYDGTVASMPANVTCSVGSSSAERKSTVVNYDIAFYLDGSVGNDYQSQSAAYDFEFWVEDTDALFIPGVTDLETRIFTWIGLIGALTALILILGFSIYKAVHKHN